MDNTIYICTKSVHMSKPLEKFNEEELKSNPFTNSLLIPVTKTYAPGQFTFHLEPGTTDIGTYLPTGFYIDKIQSSRVYYSANAKDLVYGLSDKAQRLYLYVLYNLQKSKPYVQINKDNYMKKNNVKSRITYANALKELIRYGFIAGTQFRTVYWINPMMFTSGNRIKMYPKNLEVKGEL